MALADSISPSTAALASVKRFPPPSAFIDAAPKTPLRMTEEEYLAWVGETSLTEWVAGEVVFKVPISELHDLLQRVISASLEALVRRRGIGQVRGEKWATRLPQGPSWREADMVFVASDTTSTLTRNSLIGPPDLAMEIVSPGSQAMDYRIKFHEYEAAGIPEYWIVDPAATKVIAYRLVNSKYTEIDADADGKVRSKVVDGWWLEPAELFKDPPPDALDLIRSLGLV